MKCVLSKLLCGLILLAGCIEAQTRAKDAPQAEGHVLAKKDRTILTSLPAGKWIYDSSSIQKEMKITFEGPEGTKDAGGFTEENALQISFERISDAKVRATIIKKESKTSSVIDGKPSTKTSPAFSLTGTPLILERQKDGSFHATPETGTISPQEDKVAKDLVKQIVSSDGLQIYGEKQRKVGEKWPLELDWIKSFLPPMKNVSGTASAEFLRIEDLRGSRCAVIRMPFKISGMWAMGKEAPPSDTTFEGEIVTYRSLAGLVDLEAKLDTKMVAVSKKEGVGTMTMSGPISSTTRLAAEKR